LVLGEATAQKLGVVPGDQVRLLSYNFSNESWTGLPRITVCTVIGIVSSGYQDLDRLWIFMSLELGQKVISEGSAERIIQLKIPDPYQLPNSLVSRGPIIQGLANQSWPDYSAYEKDIQNYGGGDWVSSPWFEQQQHYYNHYAATKNIIVFILSLMVLIAAVNISSTMILFFVEKQQDIAILRASGASPQHIQRTFIMMGGITGACGAFLGLVVGIGLSTVVNEALILLELIINGIGSIFQAETIRLLDPSFYLSRIPIRIHWLDQFLILIMAIILSLVASWLPARRAGRLGVLDVLRKS
jgi:lipoprotein-releasing system permease protein